MVRKKLLLENQLNKISIMSIIPLCIYFNFPKFFHSQMFFYHWNSAEYMGFNLQAKTHFFLLWSPKY